MTAANHPEKSPVDPKAEFQARLEKARALHEEAKAKADIPDETHEQASKLSRGLMGGKPRRRKS